MPKLYIFIAKDLFYPIALFISVDRKQFLNETCQLCMQIKQYSLIKYLVDFDIVCNEIENICY